MKISNISVELINKMGSDLSVVNAARVSFQKEGEWEYSTEFNERVLAAKDAKLLKYLAEHNHWSPFSHAFMSFRIKAPIFIARQLGKHQVGLSWNEVSRRYVSDEPEFYFPEYWRKKADNVKQGSSEEAVQNEHLDFHTRDTVEGILYRYETLLKEGVCPEQARMILPQNMMTEWIWSGSLYAFARVCQLRLDSHTQRDTQQVAQLISVQAKTAFPESWKVLVKHGTK